MEITEAEMKQGNGFVYVPIPEHLVQKVFRFVANDGVDADGNGGSTALIERVYRESEDSFRSLLRYLAERPDTPVTTQQVAKDLKLYRGTGSLAGMLGAYGRRATNRYDGFWPFEKG